MRFWKDVKKMVLALTVVVTGLLVVPATVKADSQLTAETEVYYANSKIYHLKGECGTLSTSSHMPLRDALGKNMKMCEACATEAGIEASKAKQLAVRDLPIKVSTNLTAPPKSDSDDDNELSKALNTKSALQNTEKNTKKATSTGNTKSVAKTTTKSTAKTTTKSTATTKSSNSTGTKSADKVVSTTKSSKSDSEEDDEDEDFDVEFEEDEEDDDFEDVATVTAARKSSVASSKKSSGSVSSKAKSSDSASASNGKELMTESQRRKKFYSNTNPKRGAKPVSALRPASNGFLYADFATFNSYSSENGLGMTPIYLLGTIKDIEKVTDKGDYYGAVLMVNDVDGYQWYMRLTVAKDKYDLFKKDYLGKTANIYGYYTGYSGVTRRPMLDPTVIIDANGFAVNMSAYK